MVGVPSFRGCEACHKQKKKCQGGQPCARCTRLKLPCILKPRRYKFLAHKGSQDLSRTSPPSPPPSNEESMVIHAFVSSLQVTDPHFDISCYGPFFESLPRRLGANKTLFTAIGALTFAHKSLLAGVGSTETYQRYGEALNVLRGSLRDPTTAQTPETMCAIYALSLCETWIDPPRTPMVGHLEMMAHYISAVSFRGFRDEFEASLVVTVTLPVITQNCIDPSLNIGPALGRLTARGYGPPRPVNDEDNGMYHSLDVLKMSRLPVLLDMAEFHCDEIRDYYDLARKDIERIQSQLNRLQRTADSGLKAAVRLYSHFRQGLCAMLAVATMLNVLVSALNPGDVLIRRDMVDITSNVLLLAREVHEHRPMGPGAMPMCLVVLWAATEDPSIKAAVTEILESWRPNVPSAEYPGVAQWLSLRLQRLRYRLTTRDELLVDYATATAMPDAVNKCCIL